MPERGTGLPLGLRLKNPTNLELGAERWFGQAPPELQHPGRYAEFVDTGGVPGEIWGLRAAVRILLTYRRKYRLRSVRQMISRWAPPDGPDKNPTDAYVRNVAAAAGVSPGEALDDTAFAAALPAILKAMVLQEQGIQPFSEGEIAQAIALA